LDVEINGKADAVDLIIKKYLQKIFEQREMVDIYYHHKIKEDAFPHQGASSMRVPSPEKGLARVGGGSEEDASIPPDLPRNQGGYGRVSGSPSSESLPGKSGDVKLLASRAGKKSAISVSFGIKVEEAFTDSMAPVWHALSYIKDQTGETLTPDRDPHVLLRLLAGTGGKIDNILEKGMIYAKNNRLVFGNLADLISAFDTTTPEPLNRDMADSAAVGGRSEHGTPEGNRERQPDRKTYRRGNSV
jgi:hypothetical protein